MGRRGLVKGAGVRAARLGGDGVGVGGEGGDGDIVVGAMGDVFALFWPLVFCWISLLWLSLEMTARMIESFGKRLSSLIAMV